METASAAPYGMFRIRSELPAKRGAFFLPHFLNALSSVGSVSEGSREHSYRYVDGTLRYAGVDMFVFL